MKTWQVLALCFSIIISIASSAFYLKYEPKTIVKSDSGTFDLGKVFAEIVTIDIAWVDISGNEEPFVSGASFYESSQPIAKALIDLNNNRNDSVAEHKKTTYDKIDNYQAGKDKIKIRTYITYFSSNYNDKPYTLVIGEQTHSLQGYAPLKDSIYSLVDKNFKAKKDEVASNLFMTGNNTSIVN